LCILSIVILETLKCALPLAAICGKWVMANIHGLTHFFHNLAHLMAISPETPVSISSKLM
jgi:hypothetical protein